MAIDSHVRLLPTQVANKIAAGEVVERPASVVKELLENAIDAGATRIDVAVTQGGRKLVSVRDDGCGMCRQDALMSLERQATSKIRDVDDIERIATLGFRGEAIPSIASVSRFTLVTRTQEQESGTRIQVNAGVVAEVSDAGAPAGTLVEVRDLFCNVPARRKFLRSYQTEENHVRNVFTVHALAHPNIGFSLSIDGRELYRLPPGATLDERLGELFGRHEVSSLAPCSYERDGIRVTGYIGRPNRADTSVRREQYVFVNGRPATAAAISYAFKEAYPRQQGDSRPAAVMFIDLPPSDVDVNVHPAKREVRFRRNAEVKAAVEEAIRGAIGGARVSEPTPPPDAADPAFTPGAVQPSLPVQPQRQDAPPQPQTWQTFPSHASLASPIAPQRVPQQLPPTQTADEGLEAAAAPRQQESPSFQTDHEIGPWRYFKFLAISESGYIVIETDAGLVLVNPQSAMERIVFEKLCESARVVSQPLLIPKTVHFNPFESARIKSFLGAITAAGFQLEEFGPDTWKVDAEPQLLGDADPGDALASIAADLEYAGAKRGGAKWREEAVARSVARTCAGTMAKLTPETAIRLVEDLAGARMPYVCPRGKPVMIFMSNRELDRKFGK